ncbi:zf-HC2 domain-containing protein [Chloroflexota bacterium]
MSWLRTRNDTIDHRYVEERLSAYLDGELSRGEQKAIDGHLATCQACRWHLDTLRQTVQWTRELPTIPVPRVFTIPARPAPAPRRRWNFVPVLQGATALVALLLVIMVAGDVMFTGILPASAPVQQALEEQAPADAAMPQIVELEAEAPAAEAERMVEKAVPEPSPSSLPQEVAPASVEMTAVVEMAAEAPMPEAAAAGEEVMSEAGPAPDEGRAEEPMAVVPTLTPTETRVGALGFEPPAEKEGEVAAGQDAAEAPLAPATAKTFAEATATMLAEATALVPAEADTAAGAAAPTQAALPTLQPPEPSGESVDTVIAEARESVHTMADEQEAGAVGAVQQPTIGWLRLAELGLLISLLLLGTFTIFATLRRRRTR